MIPDYVFKACEVWAVQWGDREEDMDRSEGTLNPSSYGGGRLMKVLDFDN